jgi:hypothetical protein
MARRSIKHARYILEKNGYNVLYSDTDSCYILDPFNKENKLEDLCNHIANIQKDSFNIPIDTHSFVKECKIKRIYFFKDDDEEFIKKHYIYVKENDQIVVKGMQFIKGNASSLATNLFDSYIKPRILKGEPIVFPFETLFNEFRTLATKFPNELTKRFRVWPLSTYKVADGKDEASGLHAQISKRYGAGEHWLIGNRKLGPGKGVHYATLDELKEKYGDNWIDVVWLSKYLSDLREFIIPKERKGMSK